MAEVNETINEEMRGDIDGNNKVFNTNYEFISGSIKPVINGKWYNNPSDVRFGFLVINSKTIQFNIAPRLGDTVACSYEIVKTVLEQWVGRPYLTEI